MITDGWNQDRRKQKQIVLWHFMRNKNYEQIFKMPFKKIVKKSNNKISKFKKRIINNVNKPVL